MQAQVQMQCTRFEPLSPQKYQYPFWISLRISKRALLLYRSFQKVINFFFKPGIGSAVALRYPAFSISRKGAGHNEEKSKRAPQSRWLSIEWSSVDILLCRKRKNAQFALGQKNVRDAHSRLPASSAGVRMEIV